jgi:hypothetical protein
MSNEIIVPDAYVGSVYLSYLSVSPGATAQLDVRAHGSAPLGIVVTGSSATVLPDHFILSVRPCSEQENQFHLMDTGVSSIYLYRYSSETDYFAIPFFVPTSVFAVAVTNLNTYGITISNLKVLFYENPSGSWPKWTVHETAPERATTRLYLGQAVTTDGDSTGTPFINKVFRRGRAFFQVTSISDTTPSITCSVIGKFPQTNVWYSIGDLGSMSAPGVARVTLTEPLPELIAIQWTLSGTNPEVWFNVWLELER